MWLSELNGLKSGLMSIGGGTLPVWLLIASVSSIWNIPSVSKSIDGTALNLPRASLTAANSICQIACSFSNFISFFVGWMLMSIVDGSTEKLTK